MSRPRDDERVDALLRDLAVGDTLPSADELVVARVKLDAAIVEERSRLRHTGPSRRLVVAASMAVVVAAVAGIVLLARPAPLAAALAEYAAVVLQSEPLEPVEGEFVLQSAELVQLSIVDGSELPGLNASQLAYLIVEDRQTWVGANGTIEVQSTTTEPQFFRADDAAAYRAAGLADVDGIGLTSTVRQQRQAIPDLPVDPEQLETFLRERIRLGGSGLPEDVLLFGELAALLEDPLTSIEIRAASVQVFDSVRGVELVEKTKTKIVIALEYTDLGRVRRTLDFDLETSQLAADAIQLIDGLDMLGIPAGTLIGQSTYEPLIVTSVGPENP